MMLVGDDDVSPIRFDYGCKAEGLQVDEEEAGEGEEEHGLDDHDF